MLIEVKCNEANREAPLGPNGKFPPCGESAVGMFNRVHLFAGGIQVPECERHIMEPARKGALIIPSDEAAARWLESKGFVKDPRGHSYTLPEALRGRAGA